MGGCCGREARASGGSGGYSHWGSSTVTRPETEADRQARALAAEKAAQRHENFATSAVGRAAYTAVKDAKKPVVGPSASTGPTMRDWQN